MTVALVEATSLPLLLRLCGAEVGGWAGGSGHICSWRVRSVFYPSLAFPILNPAPCGSPMGRNCSVRACASVDPFSACALPVMNCLCFAPCVRVVPWAMLQLQQVCPPCGAEWRQVREANPCWRDLLLSRDFYVLAFYHSSCMRTSRNVLRLLLSGPHPCFLFRRVRV